MPAPADPTRVEAVPAIEPLHDAMLQALMTSTSVQVALFDAQARLVAANPATASAHPGLGAPGRTGTSHRRGSLHRLIDAVRASGCPMNDVDLSPDAVTSTSTRATALPLGAGPEGAAAVLFIGRRVADIRSRVDMLLNPFQAAPLPTVPGASFAAVSRPAADPFGGDIYDVFPSIGGSWVAVVADVAGHDAAAATMTVVLRQALRALALVLGRPAQLLDALHRLIVTDHVVDRLCTATIARLRVLDRCVRCTLSRAGHPYPVVLAADGAIEVLTPAGGMLGLMTSGSWEETPVELRPGDALVLCSDGVAGPTGELLRLPGSGDVLRRAAGADAATIADAVGSLVTSHGAADDETVLVVRAAG